MAKVTTRAGDERTFNPATTARQARGGAQQFQAKQNKLNRLAQARVAALRRKASNAAPRS